jgi:biopolymer transport protein ExbD
MSGVSVDSGGKGGRRSVDSEINMIPMIDLLVCCISFLLITAVWSHMSRINADAQVPGPPNPEKELNPQPPDKMLHVEMRTEDHFTLIWKQGATVVNSIDVPRHAVTVDEG